MGSSLELHVGWCFFLHLLICRGRGGVGMRIAWGWEWGGEVVSCSTWMFETIPGEEPHWRSTTKAIQRLSDYYGMVSKLKILCLMPVSRSSKLFAHWLSKTSDYLRAWKRKGNALWPLLNETSKPCLVYHVLKLQPPCGRLSGIIFRQDTCTLMFPNSKQCCRMAFN